MSKQDANGVRTAADLERKYNFETLKKAVEQNEKGLTKTNKELEDFIEELGNIGEQLDGQIITWYGNGEPNLSNYPANEWSDEEYDKHVEDLYYDMDSGYPYRFVLEGTTYKWEKLSDDDLSNVLAIASHAKDTADKKRRVFVTTPTPPYDVGDLWLKTIIQKNIDGKNVNQTVLYRCSTAKGRDETYAESDFVSAVNYATNNNFETVEHKAEQAAGTATNFIQIDTSDGVIIGDISTGSVVGGNIVLQSGGHTGIYIRDGDTVLASFDDDSISLGDLDTAASISLCGVGTITGVVHNQGTHYESTSLVIEAKSPSDIKLKTGGSYIAIEESSIVLSIGNDNRARFQMEDSELGGSLGNFYMTFCSLEQCEIDDTCTVSPSTHNHDGAYEPYGTTHSKLVNPTTTVLLTGAFLRPTDNGSTYLGGSGYRWGEIYASKEVNVSSDMRLKQDFSTDFEKYIEMLDLLEPTSYHLIDDDGSRHIGYIAQKVLKAMKDVGIEESEFGGLVKEMQAEGSVYTYGLRYGEFIPILHAKIKTLEERIEKLEQMLAK